jgi:Tfp pilus assembly protein PilN
MASPNELSFLPDDYLERKAQRRTNVICAMLFLVVIVAIGSAFTFTERLGRKVEDEHALWETKYTDAAKRIQLKQQLEAKQATMEKQAELSASLLEKVPRSYLLARITNSLPPGVSLLDLALDSKPRNTNNSSNADKAKSAFEQKKAAQAAAAVSDGKKAVQQQAKIYDVYVKVSGIAFTDVQVAQFITRLNQVKLFKEVNLVISDEYKDKDGETVQLRKFQIEALLDPAAEVPAEVEKSKTAAVELKENQPQ